MKFTGSQRLVLALTLGVGVAGLGLGCALIFSGLDASVPFLSGLGTFNLVVGIGQWSRYRRYNAVMGRVSAVNPAAHTLQAHMSAMSLTAYSAQRSLYSMQAAIQGLHPNHRRPYVLPERIQQDPFIGYKTTRIVVVDGNTLLRGMTGQVYGIDAVAKCGVGRDHVSPSPLCHCGFHALIDGANDWEYGAFRTTVELFGTVIVGQLGYRASRQRVLLVEARRMCALCAAIGWPWENEAVGFSGDSKGTIIAVCSLHAIGRQIYTPAEMTAKLGTEVRWYNHE